MPHAHGYMYPSALPPCRINQVYYYPTPNAILVGFLLDIMGMFFHPKSSTTEFQLLKLPPFQLRESSNIYRPPRRPRKGSNALMHIIRRSEKLAVLAGISPSADNGRRDEGRGETAEIRRAGMGALEIDGDVQSPHQHRRHSIVVIVLAAAIAAAGAVVVDVHFLHLFIIRLRAQRSRYGAIQGGNGLPRNRRGRARIGGQSHQSTEDNHLERR